MIRPARCCSLSHPRITSLSDRGTSPSPAGAITFSIHTKWVKQPTRERAVEDKATRCMSNVGIRSSISSDWRGRTKARASGDLLGWTLSHRTTSTWISSLQWTSPTVSASWTAYIPWSDIWGNRHSLTRKSRHNLNCCNEAHPSQDVT